MLNLITWFLNQMMVQGALCSRPGQGITGEPMRVKLTGMATRSDRSRRDMAIPRSRNRSSAIPRPKQRSSGGTPGLRRRW